MLKKTLTAAVAAAVLSACPAQATETIDYRIGLNMAGTWSETVRADLDSSDADHDGTEEVAARDTRTRFALTAVMPRVSLRDGRVVKPHYDVAQRYARHYGGQREARARVARGHLLGAVTIDVALVEVGANGLAPRAGHVQADAVVDGLGGLRRAGRQHRGGDRRGQGLLQHVDPSVV